MRATTLSGWLVILMSPQYNLPRRIGPATSRSLRGKDRMSSERHCWETSLSA
jgi:hypothetical protein